MKKYAQYILIIIILIGFFGPIVKASASDPLGICISSGTTYSGWTESACKANSPGAVWYSSELEKGLCVIDGVTKTGDWTAAECTASSGKWSRYYNLLAPIGGITKFNPAPTDAQDNPLGKYLNIIIKLIIGLAAVFAVVMIVIGGIEYMTSESISSKDAGKEKIQDALLGLIIALGAYALLNTINPNLLSTQINIPEQTVSVYIENSIFSKPITAANIARCTPVTSGPCATANLSAFGAKAEGMSKICNIESGGNANAASGTDIGTDGTVFSFGLFQVNLLSNGSAIKDSGGNSCANLFVLSDGSPVVRGNYIKRDSSGKVYYDAKLKPGAQSQYNDCKNTLLDPTKNTQVAGTLFQQGTSAFNNSMFAWKGDMGVCSSAFN